MTANQVRKLSQLAEKFREGDDLGATQYKILYSAPHARSTMVRYDTAAARDRVKVALDEMGFHTENKREKDLLIRWDDPQ